MSHKFSLAAVVIVAAIAAPSLASAQGAALFNAYPRPEYRTDGQAKQLSDGAMAGAYASATRPGHAAGRAVGSVPDAAIRPFVRPNNVM